MRAGAPSWPRSPVAEPRAVAGTGLAEQREIGVWASALYPNIGGFGSESFLELPDPELKLACVRAYNDFLVDWTSFGAPSVAGDDRVRAWAGRVTRLGLTPK
jgi:hypothetical protein